MAGGDSKTDRGESPVRGAVGAAGLAFFTLLVATWSGVRSGLVRYPFKYPDSWDWLSNGLWWSGYDVYMTWRPPVLPWVYSVFFRSGLHDGIAWMPAVILGLASFAVHRAAGRLTGSAIAAWGAASVVALGAASTGFGLFIGADVAASALNLLVLLGMYRVLREQRNADACRGLRAAGRAYVVGLLWAVASLTQFGGVFLAVPFGIGALVVLGRRQATRNRNLWRVLVGFLVMFLGVYLGREAAIRSLGLSRVKHLGLLGELHDFWLYYGWYTVAMLSLPGAFLLLASAWQLWRLGRATEPLALLLTSYALTMYVFFSLFYGWKDSRFALYWLFPAICIASISIGWVERRFGKRLAVATVVVWVGWASLSTRWWPFEPPLVVAPEVVLEHQGGFNWRTGAVRPALVHVASFLDRWKKGREKEPFPLFDGVLDLPSALAEMAPTTERIALFHPDPAQSYILRGQLTLVCRRFFAPVGSWKAVSRGGFSLLVVAGSIPEEGHPCWRVARAVGDLVLFVRSDQAEVRSRE